ncbi:right-handed parallel beta-helix repeat-containing protein [Methanobrevibacter sp. TLL-48-HuF1]|uniref:chitobiase/beta-hexosaminidase C-terminal domain-containing protein n=1 Tax=Methanobrevibacter sp. TLL-48-HuF1 TaxID=2870563 RepID=UPI0020262A4A|nr:FN3 associated domain-containing protein [Methanobrevibacter sp. TLL-48-HuF1]URN49887.1 right-handed parallel beta-helix repeat-containing protein [Methanobrevibacter sp. TLL-48-HuF1]
MLIKKRFIVCIFVLFCFLLGLNLVNAETDDYINNISNFEENMSLDDNYGDFSVSQENNNIQNFNDSNFVLTVDNVSMFCRDGSRINITLKDCNNRPLANQTVIINMNGVNYTRITNNFGKTDIGCGLSVGNYTVTTYFNNISVYSWVHIKSTIIGNDLVKMFRNGTQFYATFLKGNGSYLTNTNVTFNVSGVFYTRKTNDSGVAKLNINLLPGNYILTAYNPYNNEEKAFNLIIKSLIVENHDLIKYCGNSSHFSVKVLNNQGYPAIHENVTFNINGVFYTRCSDDNGYATLKIMLLPGEYIITISFNGDSTSNKIYILPTLITHNLTMNYKDGSKFRAKILDGQGKPLSNKIVSFNVNGVFYNKTTDNYGIARLSISLLVGEYIITTCYDRYQVGNKIVIGSNLNSTYGNYFITPKGGNYNVSRLKVSIFADDLTVIKYSFDNVKWHEKLEKVSFNLNAGVRDVYYSFDGVKVNHECYNIFINKTDTEVPVVWSNYSSGVYSNSFSVKLKAYDDVDNNPVIFYTTNGSNPMINGIKYVGPFSISSTTSLKFFAKDHAGHCSNVSIVNYIFSKVGNLNNCRGFNSIQEAIDDNFTKNGDVIEVNSGEYNENIVINKSLYLRAVSESVIINPIDKEHPVINIFNVNGSIIEGFSIINSGCGIKLYNVSNFAIENNYFNKVLRSIDCNHVNNGLIYNNDVNVEENIFPLSLYRPLGIQLSYSNNMIIKKNYINLDANIDSIHLIMWGINLESVAVNSNIEILDNTIYGYRNKGTGITVRGYNITVSGNNISNFMQGFSCYDLSNSSITNNHLFGNKDGLLLSNVTTSRIYTNNIEYNMEYGVYVDYENNNSFLYLNRIFDNGQFDFYCDEKTSLNINNNWWGTNNPNITSNDKKHRYNIYISPNANFTLDSWIILSVDYKSYFIKNNILDSAKLVINLNFNNKYQDISNLGHIPDNLKVYFSYGNQIVTSFLKDGEATIYVNLSKEYVNNFVTFSGLLDFSSVNINISSCPSVEYLISSTAIDINTNKSVLYSDNFDYISDIMWFSVVWRETSKFHGAIDIIVNGEIVKSINIVNKYYLMYKNNYRNVVFDAISKFNSLLADLELLKLNDSEKLNLTLYSLQTVKSYYYLTEDETEFILKNYFLFMDAIGFDVRYGGDDAPTIHFEDEKEKYNLKFLDNTIHRISFIYYDNLIDENNLDIGYEGLRSFAFVKSKMSDYQLKYWLDYGELLPVGEMKASYGSFLSALLVIYEHDKLADKFANYYNVSWSRISPVAFSMCNDYRYVYITGESDHGMGMKVQGNDANIWNFRFACSFSYSIIEQMVGTFIWNNTKIGTVTLSMIVDFLNNNSWDILVNDKYLIFKNDQKGMFLILDKVTGIVRDAMLSDSLICAMPCYHNNITEDAREYGYNLLNISSLESKYLDSVGNFTNGVIQGINEIKEADNNITDAINSIGFDWEDFIISTAIGCVGSEIISIGAILLFAAVMFSSPELAFLAIAIAGIGEFILAYADGLFDDDVSSVDYAFFVFDSVMAWCLPLVGGDIKLGENIIRYAIKKVDVYYVCKPIFQSVYVTFEKKFIRFGVKDLILKNLYDVPFIEKIKDVAKWDVFPSFVQEIIDDNS